MGGRKDRNADRFIFSGEMTNGSMWIVYDHISIQKYTLDLFCIYFLQKFEKFFITRVRPESDV